VTVTAADYDDSIVCYYMQSGVLYMYMHV